MTNERYAGTRLNKSDGGPNFGKLVDDLVMADEQRVHFLCSLLDHLGVKFTSPDVNVVPPISPIYISSNPLSLIGTLAASLKAVSGDLLTDECDSFALGTAAKASQTIILDSTPEFSFNTYFDELGSSTLGSVIGFQQFTTSTQTILDKNPKFLECIPHGFVLCAERQTAGRGRGGNAWLSPKGSLAFSMVVHLPQSRSSKLIILVQYLASLGVVCAINSRYSVELRIKWPNDIYAKAPDGSWAKIGGVLVNMSVIKEHYVFVIGIGINATNAQPTLSLSSLTTKVKQEELLACIMRQLDYMWPRFVASGFSIFEKQYYNLWLHNGLLVSIENGLERGIIRGIDCEQGTLLVEELNSRGNGSGRIVHVVGGDNSFDMMKGLIRRKHM